jgi:hypothetical protein
MGKGAIDVKFFFREEGAPKPALILIYTIPPGAGEGVHVHKPGDAKLGSGDEFYYIISGRGEMEVVLTSGIAKASDAAANLCDEDRWMLAPDPLRQPEAIHAPRHLNV